jgi:hypothetical protein
MPHKLLKDINSVNGTEVVQQIGAAPTYVEKAPSVAMFGPATYVFDGRSTSFSRVSVIYLNHAGARDRTEQSAMTVLARDKSA